MTDIHAHILPGADDGAQSLDESLAMIAAAARDGVVRMAVTPHSNCAEYPNRWSADMQRRFNELKAAAAKYNIPVKLYTGMEIMANENIPELLRTGELLPLGDTRHVLVEFPFECPAEYMHHTVIRISREGYVPIIAHPERYDVMQLDPSEAYESVMLGAYLQINKSSITGGFGSDARKTAMQLIRHNLISIVASDAHSPYMRTTILSESRHELAQATSEEYAELLFCENPRRILEDKPPLNAEPIPF